MSVTVDRELFATEALGLRTVGQVLTHLQRDNRLIVNLLIDGKQPDLAQISRIRKSPVIGQTLYIETANPREMALEVLGDLQEQLDDVEPFKTEAADLLQKNQVSRAMEKLGIYFSSWQSAQESILKTSQLLKIDLEVMRVGSQSVAEILAEFSTQIREIKQTLVDHDYVLLTDILLYETTGSYDKWSAVLNAIRGIAEALPN